MKQLRVIGIDPSLTSTGLAGPGWGYKVKSKLKGDARLLDLAGALETELQGNTFAVMEDLPTHAKSAGLTGRAQGVVRYMLHVTNTPYIAVPPATLKKFATDKGNADKAAMVDAWNEQHPDRRYTVKDNDIVDAAWLQELGEFLLGAREYGALEHGWRHAALKNWINDPVVKEARERISHGLDQDSYCA